MSNRGQVNPVRMSRVRMSDKSRSEHEMCGASVSNGATNNEFLREHYVAIRKYTSRDLTEEIPRAWSRKSQREAAEREFIRQYDCLPTCMVFAPETIDIAATEGRDLAESKTLCMAVEFGTLIAGKLNPRSTWCHVEILDETGDRGGLWFRGNSRNPEISEEENWWSRYVKETMRSFRDRQGHIPGFKCVILPCARSPHGELSSITALVIALYTYLETITKNYASNALEKALACHLALKRAHGSFGLRLVDSLVSIIGAENVIFLFDARTLRIERCDWPIREVALMLIDIDDSQPEKSVSRPPRIQSKAITTVMHTSTRWHTRPIDMSIMESVYPSEIICSIKRLLAQDQRVHDALAMIREENFVELGELFWESYRATRDCTGNSLSESGATLERDILSILGRTDGVFGARTFNRQHGASILVLVQRSCWKRLSRMLSRMKSTRRQHYAVKPSIGASTLYARDELAGISATRKPSGYYRAKFAGKYHVSKIHGYSQDYYIPFEPAKSLSLFIPHEAVL